MVRAWLLQHDSEEISRMERAVTHVHTAKGEHAAALDMMRWAEVNELSVQRDDVERWKSLYFRVLRNTAEERAAEEGTAEDLSGSCCVVALDMSTPMLEAADCLMQLTEYRFYRTQLTCLDVPLHNITRSEALILRQFLGEQAIDGPLQGDESRPSSPSLVPPKEEPELPGPPEVALVGRRVRIYNKDTRQYVGGFAMACNGHGKLTIRYDHDAHIGFHLLSLEKWDLDEPEGPLDKLSET